MNFHYHAHHWTLQYSISILQLGRMYACMYVTEYFMKVIPFAASGKLLNLFCKDERIKFWKACKTQRRPHQNCSMGNWRIIPISGFINMGFKVDAKWCAGEGRRNAHPHYQWAKKTDLAFRWCAEQVYAQITHGQTEIECIYTYNQEGLLRSGSSGVKLKCKWATSSLQGAYHWRQTQKRNCL